MQSLNMPQRPNAMTITDGAGAGGIDAAGKQKGVGTPEPVAGTGDDRDLAVEAKPIPGPVSHGSSPEP